MLVDILASDEFPNALSQQPPSMQRIIMNKIRLLAEDPRYPSLNAHRLEKARVDRPIWECYITDSMRLIYELEDDVLRLWYVGSHAIVDKAHLRGFAANTRFSRLDIAETQTPAQPETVIMEAPRPLKEEIPFKQKKQSSEYVQVDNSNKFAFFQNAHLRILGVPAPLLSHLKQAPTLEAALQLPGLPDKTRLWLEELSTSPELESVMFDSGRLLFRTTLDQLEGYCEGKIKRLMLNLQRPEQQQFVDMEHVPLILLKGAAGSGKTTIGLYRAIHLAKKGRRVLVLTFNKTLASATKSLIEELIGPLPANLEVKTLHSLMTQLLFQHSIPLKIPKQDGELHRYLYDALNEVKLRNTAAVLRRDQKFFEEEIRGVIKAFGLNTLEEYKEVERYGRKTALSGTQREAVWKVYQAYQRRLNQAKVNEWADIATLALTTLQEKSLDSSYDDIIVDEAQDLTPVGLRVIQQLVTSSKGDSPSPSSIMILADAAQTLYARGFSWKLAGIQAKGRTRLLKKNYRNTRQIAEASAQLLEQNILMRSSNEYVDPEWTQRQGPTPILLTASSPFDQILLTKNRILDLVSDQAFRLSDFAILCPTNDLCQRCKQELESVGLRTVYHQDEDFNLLEERIKVMTIHSAKGLEFPVVFLLGLTHETLPMRQSYMHLESEEVQLYIEQQRSLCYVGMTRAAEALYLLTVKGAESRFIKELEGKIVAM